METRKLIPLYALLALNLVLVAAVIALVLGPKGGADAGPEAEALRTYANALSSIGLYSNAARVYEQYAQVADLSPEQEAKIYYQVGNLYMDREKNYREALARYVRIKELYPGSGIENDVNRRMVTCLERLGMPLDAQNLLSKATALEPEAPREAEGGQEKTAAGAVLARLGDRVITEGDLDAEIRRLPPPVQAQFAKPDRKLELLTQIVHRELLYGKAMRLGLDKDPDINARAFEAKKGIMISRLLEGEVYSKIDVGEAAVRRYYQEHPEEFAGKQDGSEAPRSFEDVKTEITRKLYQARERELTDALIDEMIRAQKVQVYSERVK